MTRLVQPSTQYAQSHASFVAEMLELDGKLVPYVLAEVGGDFSKYIEKLERNSRGFDLPPGHVTSSTFWLLNDADEIVAVSNLRHALTPFLRSTGGQIGFGVRPQSRRRGYAAEILRQTLIEARRIGIGDILVTCDKHNLGSARVILSNGGVFAGEEYLKEQSSIVQRYWIRK